MKIWTVISGVVSTLLVASILTFGLSTEIASAHGPDPACEKHHKKDDGCPPPGGSGGGGEIADEYSLVFSGELTGGTVNNLWLGKPKGVNLNDINGIDTILTLGPIPVHFGKAMGTDCFGGYIGTLFSGMVTKGKKGRAEAKLWFNGETSPIGVGVLYAIKLIGSFNVSEVDWPPPATKIKTMTMTSWETIVENEGDAIKSISCIAGPVDFGGDGVTITVEGF